MNTQNNWKTFLAFTLRVIVAHTLTYFIFGILMSNVFDYGEVFKREVIRDHMLPIDAHNVLMGPFMQPIRGLIFAIGLWPCAPFYSERNAAGSLCGDCWSPSEFCLRLPPRRVQSKECSIPGCRCGIT